MVFTKIGVIILILTRVLSVCCLGLLIINFILIKKFKKQFSKLYKLYKLLYEF